MRRQRSGVLMHISSGAGRVVLPSAGFDHHGFAATFRPKP